MTFQTIPVNIAGPSYPSRSRPVSSQSTINFYPQISPSQKSEIVLHSWPGETLFGAAVGADRGMHDMANILYRVADTSLYSVDSSGVHTSLGVIAGTDRCIFANDGEKMYIVASGLVYEYDSTSTTLSTVTDPDIVGSIAVDFLNSQFIYTKPNLFIISDVGDGSSASGLNAAQAESQPDDLVRAYVFDQIAYMVGEKTVEPWYNSGDGLPPFDRIDTQIISVGTGSTYSLASTDNFMYWLGDDRQVYRTAGGQDARVTNKAVAHVFESYAVVSDAVGFTMTLEGQNFYVLSFPSANATWVLSEELGENGWFQISDDRAGGVYNASSHLYIYGKHILADSTNGNLYELDLDAFDNNGTEIHRTRVLSSIHGGIIGNPGKRVQMSRFELIIEAGVGLISGQGEDPKIMIEASYDGGKSFDHGTWMRAGRLGETNIRAEWFSMKSFYDLIIRITTSDPVDYTIMSGAIDVRLAGR
jgi:hypothetical protein